MGHLFGIIFAVIGLGIALVGAVLFGFVKLLKGPKQESADEETRIIQEMYNTMNRLEERVESLETILIERESKE
ncbi:MAG: phage-shock protein [Proteobacteria bacterium]|nr:phage-shock protein [Pseudomonadota bacterium]